jgi:RNA polymerase sigma-70 factor (ECF subfamily)
LTDEARHWESLKHGDTNALKALYAYYADALYQYGMVLCGDHDRVKDCIHDLFLSIWDSRRNMTIPSSGKAYLIVSLRRRIFDKKSKMESLTTGIDDPAEIRLTESDHETVWIANENSEEQNQKLSSALDRLSHRQREIIHMKYYQQLEYEEIGQVMGLNYQSARNLVTRALIALRKEMLAIVIILLIVM